jgi:CO dehydrogenase maturation factor
VNHVTLAICGKGGAGKTTLSALLAREIFLRRDRKALFIDADSAGGLGLALGLEPQTTVSQIRELTIEDLRAKRGDKTDALAALDARLVAALVERGNLAFLALGRPEGEGCFCSVNSLLRQSIELLAGHFELTVIDAEAGVEQVNRQVMSGVDRLVAVSDATGKGLKVAEAVAAVAGLGDRAGLVINRARSADDARALAARSPLPCWGWVPEDDQVREFDFLSRPFFELPDCPSVRAAAQIFARALRDQR